jgi:cytochrome c-type biogenesis protein CcmE
MNAGVNADVEATAKPPMPSDLTPRTAVAPSKKRRKNRSAVILLAVAVIGIGVVLFQGLSNATMYYCNADEVGVKAACSGAKSFRVQGTVDKGSLKQEDGFVTFTISFKGATIAVRHQGDPVGIFREGIPVVLAGQMVGTTFESTLMEVKHSEQYKAKNPDRVSNDAP